MEVSRITGLPLVMIGDGPLRAALEATAPPHVRILGHAPEAVVREALAGASALVFPGEEDFGMTSLESQACGRPVIAYGAGGALESIVEEKTGLFFRQQTPEALMKAVKRFDKLTFDPSLIRRHAQEFDVEVFKAEIEGFLEEKVQEHRGKKEGRNRKPARRG